MKLEAVDRKNPHLTCVATVESIDDSRSDCLLIHFDGWTAKYGVNSAYDDAHTVRYDYWAEPSSSDLHPVGWCASHGKALAKPKSFEGSFSWPAYLASENAQIVPEACLTADCNDTAQPTLKVEQRSKPAQMRLLAAEVYHEYFETSAGERGIVTDLKNIADALINCALPNFQVTTSSSEEGDRELDRQVSVNTAAALERRDTLKSALDGLAKILKTDQTVSAFEFQSSGLVSVRQLTCWSSPHCFTSRRF